MNSVTDYEHMVSVSVKAVRVWQCCSATCWHQHQTASRSVSVVVFFFVSCRKKCLHTNLQTWINSNLGVMQLCVLSSRLTLLSLHFLPTNHTPLLEWVHFHTHLTKGSLNIHWENWQASDSFMLTVRCCNVLYNIIQIWKYDKRDNLTTSRLSEHS